MITKTGKLPVYFFIAQKPRLVGMSLPRVQVLFFKSPMVIMVTLRNS